MAGRKTKINQYGLTDMQETFCLAYVVQQFNGTQAVLSYKPKLAKSSAASEAKELTKKPLILARIEMILAATMKEMNIEAADVVQELARGATYNIKDFATWDGEGKVSIRPSDEISREAAGAVKSIKHTTRTTTQKDGSVTAESRVELTFISKEKCLELLGRYFAMYVDKKEIKSTSDLVSRMQEADKRLEDIRRREEIRGKGSITILPGDGEK